MLPLVCLLAVALAQTGGTDGGCACKDPATLPLCGRDQAPVPSTDPCGCAVCNKPECIRCTEPTKNCTNDQRPRICLDCYNQTCCPICLAPPVTCATNCPAENLPACTDTGAVRPPCSECPTCKATCDYSACTSPALLPVCNGAITREGCCDTCVPPTCTETQRTDCKTKIAAKSIPLCATGEVAKPVDCCLSCIPPAPPTTTDCTPEKVAAALATIPECQTGQRAEIVPGSCTKTCREPGTNCPPNTVTDFAAVPVCPDGVRPTFTGCTPDCRVPPPVCDPVCGTDEKCVRTPAATATIAVRCVKPDMCRTFAVAGIDTNANPTDVFALVVKRHCEDVIRSANDRCELFEALLTGSLQCKRTGDTRKDGDKVFTVVECCHARDPTVNTAAAGRRLLSGETLFGSAVNNPGATDGLQFQADPSSAAALSGFAGLLGFLFL